MPEVKEMEKVYIFVNVRKGMANQVMQALQGKAGVLNIDPVEDRTDIIVQLQATTRQKLAELTIQSMASVENMIDGIQLMPVQQHSNRAGKTTVMAQ